MAVAECYRRAQWAILRIENEQVNNFEGYRLQDEMSDLKDDIEVKKK